MNKTKDKDGVENARGRGSGDSPARHNARHLPIRVSESADDYPSSTMKRTSRRREISALFASRCEARENEDPIRPARFARADFSSLFSIAQ